MLGTGAPATLNPFTAYSIVQYVSVEFPFVDKFITIPYQSPASAGGCRGEDVNTIGLLDVPTAFSMPLIVNSILDGFNPPTWSSVLSQQATRVPGRMVKVTLAGTVTSPVNSMLPDHVSLFVRTPEVVMAQAGCWVRLKPKAVRPVASRNFNRFLFMFVPFVLVISTQPKPLTGTNKRGANLFAPYREAPASAHGRSTRGRVRVGACLRWVFHVKILQVFSIDR